jgi:hypothetical protein
MKDYGPDGVDGGWAPQQLPQQLPQGQQDPFGDYEQDGAAGGLRQSHTAASGLHSHATKQEGANVSV